MKRSTRSLLFFALYCALTILVARLGPPTLQQTPSQPESARSSDTTSTEEKNISSGPEENVLVKRVVDGDTIELGTGQKVRYIGINTPETVDPRRSVQCFGVEAKKRNQELVEGKTVMLKKDVSNTDRYGRLLRYVYVGATFINETLVEEGMAHASPYPPDVSNAKRFAELERTARQERRGLWSECAQPTKP